MVKGICTNCGRIFESRKHRQTCSFKCHRARQVLAVDQIRLKRGEIYERWKERMYVGITVAKLRRRNKKGGDR